MIRKLFARVIGYSAVAGVLFAVIAAAAYAIENWRGERAWNAYRTAAEGRGAKLFLSDFIPQPVPDDENFAATPLFVEIFKRGPGFNPFELPLGSLPSTNKPKAAPLDLTDWRDRFLNAKLIPVATDDPARDLWDGLQRYEPSLQQLRDASSRPHCQYPVKWEDGFSVAMPQLGPLQSAAVVLSLRMRAQLALDKSASAVDDWRLAVRLYRSMEREPSLICGLVRMSQLSTAIDAVRQGLAMHRWSEADLRVLTSDLAALRVLDDYRLSFGSERGFINRDEPDPSKRLEGLTYILSGYGNPPHPPQTRLAARLYPPGWKRLCQVKLNEFFDAMLHRLDSPNDLTLTVSGSTIADAHLADSSVDRVRYAISNRMIPMFGFSERTFLRAHILVLEARLGCALESFHHQFGTFPASLEELKPSWSGEWPRDIFDGRSFRYQRTERGYRLWSIGDNRVDDSGLSDPSKSPRQQPDWVWEIP